MQKKGITSTEKDIKSQNSPLVKITFLLYNLRQNNISKERNYVFAGSLDGKELAETSRALILHLTDVQATGRKKTTLGDFRIVYNWGNMDPYLLRKGKAEISLKNSAKGVVRIRALDVNGAVLAEIPFRESKGSVIFTADTDQYGAMAYELLRIP